MSAEIVIVGAGGHGRETLDIVDALGEEWRFAGFVDDGEVVAERLERRDASVVALEDLDAAAVRYVIGIGDSVAREAVDARMSGAGFEAATLVHPRATIGGDVRLALGVVLAAGAQVTTNVSLGRHTQLNVGACVSHDCEVGDFVTLSPGVYVNGECEVGDSVFFGTGAIVTPRTRIGAGAKVGAGAVVLDDVPEGATVVGVPARAAS
ncbi:MAG TPA: NeuD/PglB/VioB family sugar acetyltransferase [Solirubrobacterales bacterium]|nr:NeuD/PglB/VioB family sugar acetyltransferase [Solirubrobacterales bacterium]